MGDLQYKLEVAVRDNNILHVKHNIELLGDNAKSDRPLRIAFNKGHTELLLTINTNDREYRIVELGPVLKKIVDKILLKNRSGKDYTEWFPLLRQGYVSKGVENYLIELYAYQNDLVVKRKLSLEAFFYYR